MVELDDRLIDAADAVWRPPLSAPASSWSGIPRAREVRSGSGQGRSRRSAERDRAAHKGSLGTRKRYLAAPDANYHAQRPQIRAQPTHVGETQTDRGAALR
jgi:hypothetical protein